MTWSMISQGQVSIFNALSCTSKIHGLPKVEFSSTRSTLRPILRQLLKAPNLLKWSRASSPWCLGRGTYQMFLWLEGRSSLVINNWGWVRRTQQHYSLHVCLSCMWLRQNICCIVESLAMYIPHYPTLRDISSHVAIVSTKYIQQPWFF